MNQQTKVDTLYYSGRGEPVTELRDAGNKLILYTESKEVYRQFKDWKYCFNFVVYTQLGLLKQKSKIVAWDLDFDKQGKRALLRALNNLGAQKVAVF